MFYKVAGGSEPSTYSIDAVGATPTLEGGIACYVGPFPADPLDVFASTNDADANDTSVDAPSVTTTEPDCIVIRAYVDILSDWTASDSALNARTRFEVSGTTNGRMTALMDEDKLVAGATGAQTATVGSAGTHSAYTAAFFALPKRNYFHMGSDAAAPGTKRRLQNWLI
jgi:hypothetical protein